MPNNTYFGTQSLGEDEIRLIRILPGNWEDEIKCKLVYDSLRTIRPYYTLSYVWGSPKVTRGILMDGQAISVTVNLESALRHLRSRLQGSLLWVDALCINQADNKERTHQVKLMGDIYRLSKGVLVYLGDGVGRDGHDDSGRKVIDKISPPVRAFSDGDGKDLSNIEASLRIMKVDASGGAQHATRVRSRTMEDTVEVFSFIQALCCVAHLTEVPLLSSENYSSDKKSDFIRVFENLRQLMHAPFTPWWNRIWVVQEVILPPQVVVICGTVSAPWTMFAHAATRCLHHIRHCCSGHVEGLPRDALKVLKDFCLRIQDIDFMRATMKTKPDPTGLEATSVTSKETEILESEQRSLISLLRRFRGRKASDPRDKVYALLSLVQSTSDRPPFYPDYALSDTEVYIKAALESIYCSASLSVLSLDVARKYRQDLPSWVPDWEAPGDFSHDARMETTRLYRACTNFPVDATTVQNVASDRALGVIGKYVTRFRNVGDVMLSDSPESIRKVLTNWFTDWRNYVDGVHELPWRTFFADIIHYPQAVNIGESFRRAELEDEVMFVTWAVLSKLSPFSYKSLVDYCSLSPIALLWGDTLLLEADIASMNPENAASHFKRLYPDASVRKGFVLEAYDIASNFKQSENQGRDYMESADYATCSLEELKSRDWQRHISSKADEGLVISDERREVEYRACCQQSERKQLHAWRHLPWPQVLQVIQAELLKRLTGPSDIGHMANSTQVSIMDSSIISATKARRLFVTRERGIGLGPADLKSSDYIFLVQGGRTPFILRAESKKPSRAASRQFKLVGDCYVSGLMDSDTIEEQLKKAASSWTEWAQIYLV